MKIDLSDEATLLFTGILNAINATVELTEKTNESLEKIYDILYDTQMEYTKQYRYIQNFMEEQRQQSDEFVKSMKEAHGEDTGRK